MIDFLQAVGNWQAILFGAALSILGGFLATFFEIWLNKNQRKIKEDCILQSLCYNLHELLKCIRKGDFISKTFNASIEESLSDIKEYFTIYKSVKLYKNISSTLKKLRFEIEKVYTYPPFKKEKSKLIGANLVQELKKLMLLHLLLTDAKIEGDEALTIVLTHMKQINLDINNHHLILDIEKLRQSVSFDIALKNLKHSINTAKGTLKNLSTNINILTLEEEIEKSSARYNQKLTLKLDSYEQYISGLKRVDDFQNEVVRLDKLIKKWNYELAKKTNNLSKEMDKIVDLSHAVVEAKKNIENLIEDNVKEIYKSSSWKVREYLFLSNSFSSIIADIPDSEVKQEFWERVNHFVRKFWNQYISFPS